MIARALIFAFALLALVGCASTPRATLSSAPHAIDLQTEQRIATMHFRPGVYFLDGADSTGWFYRAPDRVLEHSFGGYWIKHEGGIFLARSDGRLRGYVDWAGGRTKIGNISSIAVRFL